MPLLGSRQILGLDIGSSSVKAMVLRGGKGGYTMQSFGIEHLPPEVIVDQEIMDSTVIVEAIQKILKTQKIKLKDVATSLSGHSVIVKKIPLPKMSAEELAESIQWEAEQYIPFDIEEVNLDFQILEDIEGEDATNMNVVIVAVKKNKIDDIVNLLTQANLNPAVVDIDSFALQNQYEINYGIESDSVIALINIGASIMNINIINSGIHVMQRDISLGGNQYTDAIQKELDVNYNHAEGLKMGEEVKGIDPKSVDGIIRSVNEDITLEIQRSFDYFRSISDNEKIDKIVLTGGSSKIKGLDSYLFERLGINVEFGDPFKNIRYNEKKFDPEFIREIAPHCAIVAGLAIRRPGDKYK